MLHVDVRPRMVAPPWEECPWRSVYQEADVQPEPGPLALYRSVWPHRYVTWNVKRQLFEIREENPVTGQDERVELLCFYDYPPDPETGEERTDEEVALMVENRVPGMVQRFLPFDYEFVRERLRQRSEMLQDLSRHADRKAGYNRYAERIARRNRARRRSQIRDWSRETAAWLREDRRWLPVLESGDPADRTPQVAVGVNFD